jgi:hypothetical protein
MSTQTDINGSVVKISSTYGTLITGKLLLNGIDVNNVIQNTPPAPNSVGTEQLIDASVTKAKLNLPFTDDFNSVGTFVGEVRVGNDANDSYLGIWDGSNWKRTLLTAPP